VVKVAVVVLEFTVKALVAVAGRAVAVADHIRPVVAVVVVVAVAQQVAPVAVVAPGMRGLADMARRGLVAVAVAVDFLPHTCYHVIAS
jgi:hypothetical protein